LTDTPVTRVIGTSPNLADVTLIVPGAPVVDAGVPLDVRLGGEAPAALARSLKSARAHRSLLVCAWSTSTQSNSPQPSGVEWLGRSHAQGARDAEFHHGGGMPAARCIGGLADTFESRR